MRTISSYEEFSGVSDAVCTVETLRRLVRRAMRDGRAREARPRFWEVYYQMNCDTPWLRRLVARDSVSRRALAKMSVHAMYRCRKCRGCMQTKGRYWAARVCREYREWPVTLMGTFTMSPEQHALLDARVSRKQPIVGLPQGKVFQLRAKEFYVEVQGYLNRLRSAAYERNGGKTGVLRYLFVAEEHNSAKTSVEMRHRPHFHSIVHETERGALIEGHPHEALRKLLLGESDTVSGEYVGKKYQNSHGEWVDGVFLTDEAIARRQWTFGLSKFQVCFSEESAFYVCKYLGKEGSYRVNPSLYYGDEDNPKSPLYVAPERNSGRNEVLPRAEQGGVSTPPTG